MPGGGGGGGGPPAHSQRTSGANTCDDVAACSLPPLLACAFCRLPCHASVCCRLGAPHLGFRRSGLVALSPQPRVHEAGQTTDSRQPPARPEQVTLEFEVVGLFNEALEVAARSAHEHNSLQARGAAGERPGGLPACRAGCWLRPAGSHSTLWARGHSLQQAAPMVHEKSCASPCACLLCFPGSHGWNARQAGSVQAAERPPLPLGSPLHLAFPRPRRSASTWGASLLTPCAAGPTVCTWCTA